MNKCCFSADFDLQSPLVTNVLVFESIVQCEKECGREKKTGLQVFKSKATPCFMLISFLIEAFFIFSPDLEQRPPPEPDSDA